MNTTKLNTEAAAVATPTMRENNKCFQFKIGKKWAIFVFCETEHESLAFFSAQLR